MTLIAVTALSLDLAAHVKHASKFSNLEAKLVYLRGEVDFLRTRLDDGDEYYHQDEETYYDEGEDEVRYSPSFYNKVRAAFANMNLVHQGRVVGKEEASGDGRRLHPG